MFLLNERTYSIISLFQALRLGKEIRKKGSPMEMKMREEECSKDQHKGMEIIPTRLLAPGLPCFGMDSHDRSRLGGRVDLFIHCSNMKLFQRELL